MLQNIVGTKIGMTQLFDSKGNVIPVTVVNVANWYVLQIKTVGHDGYSALQLGLLKERYRNKPFSAEWLKDKAKFFLHIKEVSTDTSVAEKFTIGQLLDFTNGDIQPGVKVNVTARSRGLGFQGVVKRWGFAGGPGAHGSTFHRRPGSLGNMRRQGEVLKGKRLPGHAGFRNFTVRGLTLVKLDQQAGCIFIKGALPGKTATLVHIKMQGV
ncbi:50S ribosomal protein L3 [Candidatus Dependentiae bacterium]|nr:50S ribosomal protein L3 [Candidatus Dependentiae bacterium]